MKEVQKNILQFRLVALYVGERGVKVPFDAYTEKTLFQQEEHVVKKGIDIDKTRRPLLPAGEIEEMLRQFGRTLGRVLDRLRVAGQLRV
jgi:hypothetical protein